MVNQQHYDQFRAALKEMDQRERVRWIAPFLDDVIDELGSNLVACSTPDRVVVYAVGDAAPSIKKLIVAAIDRMQATGQISREVKLDAIGIEPPPPPPASPPRRSDRRM